MSDRLLSWSTAGADRTSSQRLSRARLTCVLTNDDNLLDTPMASCTA